MKLLPIAWITGFVLLGVFGSFSRSFPMPKSIECVYQMAAMDAPSADILFLGSSRTGRGIDPVYIENRLTKVHGLEFSVERIALEGSFSQQYRPVLQTYLNERGAPHILFLQVLYNFKREIHPQIDLPINPGQNIAYADLGDVIDIHRTAELNSGTSPVSRRLSEAYMSLPASLLARLELNVYSALKLPVHALEGRRAACRGEQLYRHNHPIRLYGDLNDDLTFISETPEQNAQRLRNEQVTANYLPMAPSAPWRRFENQQMRSILDLAAAAGSKVILYYLPAVGEKEFPDGADQEFASLFTEAGLVHPMSLYDGPHGEEIAVSYFDTHHYDRYGALLASRYFADRLVEILP